MPIYNIKNHWNLLIIIILINFFSIELTFAQQNDGWGLPPPELQKTEQLTDQNTQNIEQAQDKIQDNSQQTESQNSVELLADTKQSKQPENNNPLSSKTTQSVETKNEKINQTLPEKNNVQDNQKNNDTWNFLKGFLFGSYGRVGAGTDLRGGSQRPVTVVNHGPRLTELPYLELDFHYRMTPDDFIKINIVTTTAITGEPFHYTGDFTAEIALRNLYAEAIYNYFGLWAGSRMYRGDDIYLLDYWPLDNLNTIGGGIFYDRRPFWIGFHAGINRLNDEYQYQEIEATAPDYGSQEVIFLNRQRVILSLKAVYQLWGTNPDELGLKFKFYGEMHYIPSGTLKNEDDNTEEDLSQDYGWCIGGQFGLWGFGQRNTHLNLFLRYSRGLAAYGEMGIPYGLDTDKTSIRAQEFVFGISGNYEYRFFSILLGSYVRYFKDADPNVYDLDDKWEYIFVLRPHLFWLKYFASAIEVSYEQSFPNGLNTITNQQENPAILAFSAIPFILTPFGPGSYTRPHIRLVYRFAYLNDGVKNSFSLEDPRREHTFEHYIGIQAEWWFNSTYR